MREEEIVRLLQSRQEGAVAAAMEHYGQRVERMVGNILGADRKEDIEECVSDVFMKVWQDAAGYDPEKGSLLSWIYAIARHTAIDRLRRLKGKDAMPLQDFAERECLGITPDFSDSVAQRENAAVIREAVHRMGQPDRNIFLLRYFYFLPVKEIAQQLGMSGKQVENRLRRGRQRLKKELTERGVILE